MVIHCTTAVLMPNSPMSVGNVTFMELSTTTPENDMMPAAITDATTRGVSFCLLSTLYSPAIPASAARRARRSFCQFVRSAAAVTSSKRMTVRTVTSISPSVTPASPSSCAVCS